MSQNEHIDDFLTYYLFKCLEPNYAVLIKGKWGCGKSYYIKNYLNSHGLRIIDNFTDKQKNVVIYLSLYGVSSKEEINEKVLACLYPIISSSKIDLLQKILKTAPASAVLSALSVAMFNSTLPAKGVVEGLDIFVDHYRSEIKKNRKKKIVLVLDDFERAHMPVIELLGFVNECVEFLHIPCIIIAEKDVLINAVNKQKDESTMYGLSVSLEKVVGKELQVETSVEKVVDYWVDKCYAVSDEPTTLISNKTVFEASDDARKILKKNRDLIVLVVKLFGQDNLRAMKHVLVDFDRFVNFTKIGKLLDGKDEFARLLLGDFLIYQYAQELGLIEGKKLEITSPFLRAAAKLADEKNRDSEQQKNNKEWLLHLDEVPSIRNRLNDGSYERDWLPLWSAWLTSNTIDQKKLSSVIRSSIWFGGEDDYLLNKLCNRKELNDAELQKCYNKFDEIFKNPSEQKNVNNPVLLIHLFDSLLTLSKNKNIIDTPDELILRMNNYVLENAEFLNPVDNDVLIFDEAENVETSGFANVIMQKIKPQREVRRKEYAAKFFEYLKSDDVLNVENARIALAGQEPTMDVLELKKENSSQFIDVILNYSREDATRLIRVLGHRYSGEKTTERFEKEKEFLENVKNETIRRLKETPRPQPLSMDNLRVLKKKIENIFNYVSKIKVIDEECSPSVPEKKIVKTTEPANLDESKRENESLMNEDNVTPESHECTDTENDVITSHMDGNFADAETKENVNTLNITEAEK